MPHFQASAVNLVAAKQRAEAARDNLANKSLLAVEAMRVRHQAEVEASAHPVGA